MSGLCASIVREYSPPPTGGGLGLLLAWSWFVLLCLMVGVLACNVWYAGPGESTEDLQDSKPQPSDSHCSGHRLECDGDE